MNLRTATRVLSPVAAVGLATLIGGNELKAQYDPLPGQFAWLGDMNGCDCHFYEQVECTCSS